MCQVSRRESRSCCIHEFHVKDHKLSLDEFACLPSEVLVQARDFINGSLTRRKLWFTAMTRLVDKAISCSELPKYDNYCKSNTKG